MARDPGLDAVKTLAIALVVAEHAALSYMITPIGWVIQDTSRSLGVDLFVWIAHGSVMPTLFWLSGYFARDVYERKAALGFVRDRARRILLPLVLALVPCSLALDAMWDWARELTGRPEVAENIPKLEGSKLPLTLGHLWYFYYLLIISALALMLAEVGRRARTRVPVWVAPILVFVPLACTGKLQLDTPLGFRIHPWVTLFAGAFFAWGWLVHARPAALDQYARHSWRILAAAALLLAAVFPTLASGTAPLYAIAASGAFSCALVAAFVGLCARYVRRPILPLASRASYWTYVAHLPLVVLLQIAFARVSLPGPIEYVAIVAATALVCLLSYAAFARVRGSFAASRRSTDTPAPARSADTP